MEKIFEIVASGDRLPQDLKSYLYSLGLSVTLVKKAKYGGIMLNGKKWDKTVVRFEGEKTAYYFADADLIDNNIIEVFV